MLSIPIPFFKLIIFLLSSFLSFFMSTYGQRQLVTVLHVNGLDSV